MKNKVLNIRIIFKTYLKPLKKYLRFLVYFCSTKYYEQIFKIIFNNYFRK